MRPWTTATVGLLLCLTQIAEARGTAETQIMALINNARVAGTRCNGAGGTRLSRLTFNPKLALAAESHARNMAARGIVSHFFAGIGPRVRVVRTGYRFSRMSEIIFMGSGHASSALTWWQHSRVHCGAMMNPNYTQIGAGYSGGAWVVVMARPK